MKKLLLSCLAVGTFAFAEVYTQSDRIEDMQKMAEAMKKIQTGFFYNNPDSVNAGAETLKAAIFKIKLTVKDTNDKNVYEKWLTTNASLTRRTQVKVEEYCDVISERFSDGNKKQALQVYNKIASECIKCHVSPYFTYNK